MNRKNIFITIITVCYNSEKTINDCLKSVYLQKLKDYEHLLIDGQSKDETVNIVKKFKAKNKNNKIKIFCGKDKGIYDAINKGVRLAKGKIISILHSDDQYYNNQTLNIVKKNFVRQKNLDILIGTTLMINQIKALIQSGIPKENILLVNLEDPRFLNHLDTQLLEDIYNTYLEYLNPSDKPYIFLDIAM